MPPSAELLGERLDRLRAALPATGLDALWIEPSVGLAYLTGLEPVSLERLFGLVVRPEGDLLLVVPELLADECEALPQPAQLFVWDDAAGPDAAAAAALKDVARAGIQGSLPAWSWSLLRSVRPGLDVDVEPGLVAELRRRKDSEEVAAIRRSGAATDEMVAWAGTLEVTALTEAELAGRIQSRYLEMGLRPSPHGLIASGPNSAMPHHVASDVPISKDDLLLMDIGCALDGYWSDITRIYFPSPFDGEMKRCYEVVRAAYEAAFATVAPGVGCKDVDAAARRVISDAGYGERFIHRTGHGLGLEVHEPPYLHGASPDVLEVGDVFSIEPGIYLPGRFGVRYENIVYLGDAGPESMNHSPDVHHL